MWGTLGPSPPRAAQGELETPRCHLTIPLLVNRREDATGSGRPASPSRAEVTCWERLLDPPAGLSGSVLRPGYPPTFHTVVLGPFFTLLLLLLRFPSQFPRAQGSDGFSFLFFYNLFLRAFCHLKGLFLRHSEQKYSSEKQ